MTIGNIASGYDVVLVSVKAYALERALEDFAPAVGSQTMVLPVLNGMRHLDTLTGRFGEHAVLGGVGIVATMLDDQGRIVQLADTQELIYGELNGAASARVRELDAQMQGAGLKARSSATIVQEMWEKWVFLATLGGITCLMRGTVGEIEAAPGGTDLARQLLSECAAIAAASGYQPGEGVITRIKATVTAPGSPLASSMYRDLQHGRNVEVDHILGDLLERARRLGVSAPLLTAAFAHLRIYQQRAAAQ